MNWTPAEKIADAVLYEGYLLYPYRPSAIKNRQRWNFGVVYPRVYSERQTGSDPWTMHTECLVEGTDPIVQIKLRCLQLSLRTIGELAEPVRDLPASGPPQFRTVERFRLGDGVFQPWQEAIVQQVTPPVLHLKSLREPLRHEFHFPAAQTYEALRDDGGQVVAVIIRERRPVDGIVEISAQRIIDTLSKVSVTIQNTTGIARDDILGREAVLMHSLLSAHTVLCAEKGQFVSLLEPPDALAAHAAECRNNNTWPVLVGDAGSRDVMLSSPIILYDYPQIAPESPGDLFDGTEIDEILALRIMTMTDDEKKEVREADPRGRELLERTETLPADHLMKLHGVLRGLRPSQEKAS